jgi:N-acetylmuramoyl-L-alanine amidase
MRKLLILIILLIIVLSVKGKDSNNLVVIIDPGHGGKDVGCHPENTSFFENGYCYDVSLRLEKILKDSGFIVFKTIVDKKRKINNNIYGYIPQLSKAIFSIDGKIVERGKSLSKRTDFANSKMKKFNDYEMIFISIHFDFINSNFSGARIIIEKDNERSKLFSSYLEREFKNKNLLSNSFFPVFDNGDPIIYKRNLYVLGDKNKVSPKVLVELGNIQNKEDLIRIKDPNIRDEYAKIIFIAIKKYIQRTDQ